MKLVQASTLFSKILNILDSKINQYQESDTSIHPYDIAEQLLKLREISADEYEKVIKKILHNLFAEVLAELEVIISLVNGTLFAVVIGIISYLWFNMPMLGVVIGLSMIINLLGAGFFGSTVLLTTVTDVVGFFSFLG